MKIPFNKPYITGKEIENIARVLDGTHLSGDGEYTKKCHEWFEQTLGCHRALLTHSCTAALEIAAMLYDIGPGDEVIMPSFTFVSTANAFFLRGAKPVFVDIERETLNIDPRKIGGAITARTKAVVPVHYAGVPCEMDAIKEICQPQNIGIIEDAAQGISNLYNGHHLGTIGDLGAISFHETKNIISGEGGVLLINNEAYAEQAEIIREKGTNRTKFFRGQVDKYEWVGMGSSYLPAEIVAAFLYAQLENIAEITERRKQLWEAYFQAFERIKDDLGISLPSEKTRQAGNSHLFYILVNSRERATRMQKYLEKHGIGAVRHYVPLHSSPMGKQCAGIAGSLDVTEDIAERLIRMPLFHELTVGQIEWIVDVIKNFD